MHTDTEKLIYYGSYSLIKAAFYVYLTHQYLLPRIGETDLNTFGNNFYINCLFCYST